MTKTMTSRYGRLALTGGLALALLIGGSTARAEEPMAWQTRAANRMEKAASFPIVGGLVVRPIAARLALSGLRAQSVSVDKAYRRAYKQNLQSFGVSAVRGLCHFINAIWLAPAAIFEAVKFSSTMPGLSAALVAVPVAGAVITEAIFRGDAAKVGNVALLREAQRQNLPGTRLASDLAYGAKLVELED